MPSFHQTLSQVSSSTTPVITLISWMKHLMERILSMQRKWQRGQTIDVSLKDLEMSTRHTLIVPNALMELHPVSITSGTCKPTFTAPIAEACFGKSEEDHDYAIQAKDTDLAFFLRLQNLEIKPSWSVFNQSLPSKEPEQTAVGY